jgi:hypothetical protein
LLMLMLIAFPMLSDHRKLSPSLSRRLFPPPPLLPRNPINKDPPSLFLASPAVHTYPGEPTGEEALPIANDPWSAFCAWASTTGTSRLGWPGARVAGGSRTDGTGSSKNGVGFSWSSRCSPQLLALALAPFATPLLLHCRKHIAGRPVCSAAPD